METSLQQTCNSTHPSTTPLASKTKPGYLPDVRIALLCAGLFSITAAISQTLPVSAANIIVSLFIFLLVRCKLSDVLKRMAVVNLFVVFLWLFLPWTHEGETLFSLSFVNITKEGVHASMLITLKANAIVLACSALLSPFSIEQIAVGLSNLGVPSKLALLFSIMIRYISLLKEEYTRTKNAAQLRGFKLSLNLKAIQTLSEILATIIISATKRGENILNAMNLRGFSSQTLKRNGNQQHDAAPWFRR